MKKATSFINRKKQSGSIIIISLMFLMGLSLIAVSAMKVGNLNMKIINNENQKELLRFKTQQALERTITDPTSFAIETEDVLVDGQVVSLQKQCLFAQQAGGYGANFTNNVGGDLDNGGNNLVPQDTVWRIKATAQDLKGVSAGVIQGIEMRMLAGFC
jgi:hypothetical protein